MSYDCPMCDWTSGEESDGQTMPDYRFKTDDDGDRVQVAHCPECDDVLDSRKNNLRGI